MNKKDIVSGFFFFSAGITLSFFINVCYEFTGRGGMIFGLIAFLTITVILWIIIKKDDTI
jgi:hypothetical protein